MSSLPTMIEVRRPFSLVNSKTRRGGDVDPAHRARSLCRRRVPRRPLPVPAELVLPSGNGDLPDAVQRAGYFVLAEAPTNTVKHAGASFLEVRLTHDAGLMGQAMARSRAVAAPSRPLAVGLAGFPLMRGLMRTSRSPGKHSRTRDPHTGDPGAIVPTSCPLAWDPGRPGASSISRPPRWQPEVRRCSAYEKAPPKRGSPSAPERTRTSTDQSVHKALNLARLPIPPQALGRGSIAPGSAWFGPLGVASVRRPRYLLEHMFDRAGSSKGATPWT